MCDFKEINHLIDEWEGKLLRYASQILKDQCEAQDAVQNAFVRYIRKKRDPECERIIHPGAWLLRATRNICLDLLKSARSKKELPLSGEFFSSFASPDVEAAQSDDIAMMRELIGQLSPREQEILALRFEQKLRYEQIAQIMDLSLSNTGVLLHQTIGKLKKAWSARVNRGEL
ncbi:MAG: sigma-70 family RNA polymerase sigma factor [Lentisphaeria bacterium]|nr:sigma-70 family RNA polymerase sigma factor [Lentisphaeria bacterium]